MELTSSVCQSFFSWFPDLKNGAWDFLVRQLVNLVKRLLKKCPYVWGTQYNYLFDMEGWSPRTMAA